MVGASVIAGGLLTARWQYLHDERVAGRSAPCVDDDEFELVPADGQRDLADERLEERRLADAVDRPDELRDGVAEVREAEHFRAVQIEVRAIGVSGFDDPLRAEVEEGWRVRHEVAQPDPANQQIDAASERSCSCSARGEADLGRLGDRHRRTGVDRRS